MRTQDSYQAPALRVATQEDVLAGRVDVAIGFADLWLLSLDELERRIALFESETVH